MAEIIREAFPGDYADLMSLLGKYHGDPANYGYLIRDTFQKGGPPTNTSFVIEKDGRLVAHAGAFLIELAAGPAEVAVSGVGYVATDENVRGKGYMSRLLLHCISEMEKNKVPLSVLWGDRSRYGRFGWELSGGQAAVSFTKRSFESSGCRVAAGLKEAGPGEAAEMIGRLHETQTFRARRGRRFDGLLSRAGNRIWLAEGGYLCGTEQDGELRVNEAVEVSGNPAGLIRGVMERLGLERAEMLLCQSDGESLDKLLGASCGWRFLPVGMFRINDLKELLAAFLPLLRERASLSCKNEELEVCLSVDRGDRVEKTGIVMEKGDVSVSGSTEGKAIELSEAEAARLFLGGPVRPIKEIEVLKNILPLPVYVPPLDRV